MIKTIKTLSILISTLILSLFVSTGVLAPLANFTFDKNVGASGEISSDVVIIGIDDDSIADIGRFPWDRDVYAKLVDNLVEGNAAAIGFDIIFSEEQGIEDEVFRDSIAKTDSVLLATYGDLYGSVTQDDEKKLIAEHFSYPNETLLQANPNLGYINTLTDDDNVVRRIIPYIYDNESMSDKTAFSYSLYNMYAEKNNIQPTELNPSFFNRPYIYYAGESGTIETIPFYLALDKEAIPPEYFYNKIVLVGITASGGEDVYYTPAGPMYGVEIHANFINNLILDNFKTNAFKHKIIYITEDLYIDTTFLLSILALGILYLTLTLTVKGAKKKAFISLAAVLTLIILSQILFNSGYIVIVFYEILALFFLLIVDLVIDFIFEKKEKRKITNIFNKYMSKDVVNKIIEDGEESIKLGGHKRDVTAMFLDIRGFTTISENNDPEQVVAILNEYLTIATDIILKNNGILDKYTGDGLMALFNVPYDIENPEYMCIKSAFEIMESSKALYSKTNEKYGVTIGFGIGINCGEAIVGNIGSTKRMDYTAIGDTINTAARLESNAKAGQILISEKVYEKVKHQGKVEVNLIGEFQFKGKETKILTFEVTDINKGD